MFLIQDFSVSQFTTVHCGFTFKTLRAKQTHNTCQCSKSRLHFHNQYVCICSQYVSFFRIETSRCSKSGLFYFLNKHVSVLQHSTRVLSQTHHVHMFKPIMVVFQHHNVHFLKILEPIILRSSG